MTENTGQGGKDMGTKAGNEMAYLAECNRDGRIDSTIAGDRRSHPLRPSELVTPTGRRWTLPPDADLAYSLGWRASDRFA